eukprot:5866108-Alexandrium_andersonii.AAC.1
MSASLVGSEMCIRDRERRNACSIMVVYSNGSATQRASTTVGRDRASVSYTHLTLPTICSV